jgi:hypothetical protein
MLATTPRYPAVPCKSLEGLHPGATNRQISGMRGVYLVAAELSRLQFIASPTSRSAFGADILVTTHDCARSFSVQVKTNTTKGKFFLLGKHANAPGTDSHIYVLVDIRKRDDLEEITYYPVPSKFIAENAEHQKWNDAYSIKFEKIFQFQRQLDMLWGC